MSAELQRLYTHLIRGKKFIVENFEYYFKREHMNVELFVKELFLEASEC
jgi:hypothetical protein